jgi:membrane protease YdiL (CAAX protease family)
MQIITKPLLLSLLFVTGIFIFAWFIGSSGYLHWIAIVALILPTVALALQVNKRGEAWLIIHQRKNNTQLFISIIIALAVGIFFATKYRQNIGMDTWPMVITSFAWTAMAIGATEELIFRGALYYIIQSKYVWRSIIITSLAHAGYKTLLFVSPYAEQSVDTVQLFIYTFISGLLLGSLRAYSASTAPPLVAHISWDAVVYGDSAMAPWWVW